MAFMIPQDVKEFKTDGEKQFYSFLDSNAKPDDSHIAWYAPDIDDREPDFILYSKKIGSSHIRGQRLGSRPDRRGGSQHIFCEKRFKARTL